MTEEMKKAFESLATMITIQNNMIVDVLRDNNLKSYEKPVFYANESKGIFNNFMNDLDEITKD